MISRRAVAMTFVAALSAASVTPAGRIAAADVAHLKENDVYIGARDNGAVIISQHTTTEFQCLPDTLRPLGLTGRSR